MKKAIFRSGGFTLIELMVAVAVMIVVLAIGIPGIARLKIGGELTTTTNDLVGTLNFARSEAVRRGQDVSVNPEAGGWSDGWTVNDAAGTDIRVFPEVASASTVTATVSPITFDSLGNVMAAGCFDISVDGSVRSIPIEPTGRASVCKHTCDKVAAVPICCTDPDNALCD